MDKIFQYILIVSIIFFLAVIPIGIYFSFSKENFIAVFGYLFVSCSAILVFTQIRMNYQISKRKSGFDFIQSKMTTELSPIYSELKDLTNIQDLLIIFQGLSLSKLIESDNFNHDEKKKLKFIGIRVLNFYERMAIGILKDVLDEDICYDDQGLILIYFYKWSKSFVEKLRIEHEEVRIFVNFEEIAENWMKDHSDTNNKIVVFNEKFRNKKTIKNQKILDKVKPNR